MEPRGNLAVIPNDPSDELSSWKLLVQQAEIFVKGGLTSVRTPEAAISIMVLGRELGFQPMQSFRLIDVINNKPTLNAGGMAAMVQTHCRKHGGYLRVIESSDQIATIEFKRAEWPDAASVSFSMDDAKRAGLAGKDGPWKLYPRNMLYARAMANACRMGFPDVVAGLYDPDELAPAMPSMTRQASEPGALDDPNVIDAEPGDPREGAAMRRLHAIGRDRDLNHEDLRRVGQIRHKGLASLTELDEAALNALAAEIETASEDDLALWTTNWDERIARAGSHSELETIAEELKRGGIGRATRPDLTIAWKARKSEISGGELPGMPADVDRFTA